MSEDIVSAIDRAIGCQTCEGDLAESVSDDFCSEACQRRWHARQGDPLEIPRSPSPALRHGPTLVMPDHEPRTRTAFEGLRRAVADAAAMSKALATTLHLAADRESRERP